MKIEISIEKDGEKEDGKAMDSEEELTPKQIAEMAKKIMQRPAALSRKDRKLLADILLNEAD
jgi:hypothetical protein